MGVAAGYLARVRDARRRETTAREALEREMAVRDSLMAIDYSAARVAGGAPDGRLAACIERVDGLIAQYAAAVSDCAGVVGRAEAILACMEGRLYAALLEGRYIACMTWGGVAEALGYSEAGIYKLRPHALLAFYDAMPPREREPSLADRAGAKTV